jgi:hypothetical protein
MILLPQGNWSSSTRAKPNVRGQIPRNRAGAGCEPGKAGCPAAPRKGAWAQKCVAWTGTWSGRKPKGRVPVREEAERPSSGVTVGASSNGGEPADHASARCRRRPAFGSWLQTAGGRSGRRRWGNPNGAFPDSWVGTFSLGRHLPSPSHRIPECPPDVDPMGEGPPTHRPLPYPSLSPARRGDRTADSNLDP